VGHPILNLSIKIMMLSQRVLNHCKHRCRSSGMLRHVFVLFNDDVNNQDLIASVIDRRMSKKHWWNDSDRGKPKYSTENPVPVLLCLPQIQQDQLVQTEICRFTDNQSRKDGSQELQKRHCRYV
jgi:hypothetical protein